MSGVTCIHSVPIKGNLYGAEVEGELGTERVISNTDVLSGNGPEVLKWLDCL